MQEGCSVVNISNHSQWILTDVNRVSLSLNIVLDIADVDYRFTFLCQYGCQQLNNCPLSKTYYSVSVSYQCLDLHNLQDISIHYIVSINFHMLFSTLMYRKIAEVICQEKIYPFCHFPCIGKWQKLYRIYTTCKTQVCIIQFQ